MGNHSAMVSFTMQTFTVVLITILISAMVAEEPTPELKSSRKPKVYLISTTTSTTTLSTSSVCFIMLSTANGLTSCKKKKRSIGFLEEKPSSDDAQSELIAPNPSLKTVDEEALAKLSEIADVTGGKNDDDDEREAKFFNYWMTTTVTTTYTSYTSTSSLGSLYCTPIGYENLNCPANG